MSGTDNFYVRLASCASRESDPPNPGLLPHRIEQNPPPPPSLSDRTHHHQNTRHGNLSGVAARQERVGTKEVVWGPLVVHTGDEKMSHDEGDVSEASGCHAFD